MEYIFIYANNIMHEGFLFAVLGSLIWGFLSVILSPCHLAGIPLMVSFIIKGREEGKKTSSLWVSILFSLGILITILILGIITLLLGKILGDTGVWVNYLVGIILIITGSYLLELISFDFSLLDQTRLIGMKKSAFITGILFGLTLGPCTFAYMAPIMAVTFKYASQNVLYAGLLYFVFALGHTTVIAFAGIFVDGIMKILKFEKKSNIMGYSKKICGILIILAGFYLLLK
ncbi:MAG: cytochrome c biogenesis protein CcdA [Candidatus Muirbacterium halophilum]|nr:cytochrome c biogenesis protein CcdA [Candidatus Muirbacterium halophilum]MCK9474317.1 cytochrome c biogenesis protein CcdA [Candidatus Muirbacterium halophilum]